MNPTSLDMVFLVIGILGLMFSGLIIMAAINAKQKAELRLMELRLQNLRMMKFYSSIGKEKK